MTRYRNAPPMGLRPAPLVEPRAKADPAEMGVSCLVEAIASFAILAGLAALIVLWMVLG